jgi:hypothetical protein
MFADQLIIALILLDIVVVAGYFWLDSKVHRHPRGK